jgi:hypothetical protein
MVNHLNIFASDQNRAAIYFRYFNEIFEECERPADSCWMLILLADEANKNVKWDMHLAVYNLNGSLVDYKDVYEYAGSYVPGYWSGYHHPIWIPGDYEDLTMIYDGIYNTSMKVTKL